MESILENSLVVKRLAQGRIEVERWLSRLEKIRKFTEENLHGNSVQLFSFKIYEEISTDLLDYDTLEAMIHHLSDEGFMHRLKQLKKFIPAENFEENKARILTIFVEIARQNHNDFHGFCDQLEKIRYGIVLTAHPTFSQNRDTQKMLSQLVAEESITGADLDPDNAAKELVALLGKTHIPETDIDLQMENEWAQQTILITQRSVRCLYHLAFEVARTHFPKQWQNFQPALVSIASWVGYDTDGRNDISWQVSFRNRLSASIIQLGVYQNQLQEMIAEINLLCGDNFSGSQELHTALQQIQTEYQARQSEIELLDADDVKIFGRRIYERSDRLKNTKPLRNLLMQAAKKITHNDQGDEIITKILVLNAEMRNYGLTSSHCHVRLNSVQLHNALWQILGLVGEIQENTTWRRYIRKLDSLFETVTPVTINFGVVNIESMNARRLMMVAKLMLDYVDDSTPIRFLLAECENPFTILCGLYLARLFGIEEKMIISPLFETPRGLAKGSDIIAHLLDNSHYRQWVEKIGLVPVEAGFSDAGRFSGQITATLAIERMYIKLIAAMAQRKVKADLLTFNTHGESVGRGGFGQSFAGRLDYLLPPQVRRIAERKEVNIIHETSFQGSDGYILLGTPKMAFAVIADALAHSFLPTAKKEDPFYSENDSALSFFQRIKRFNETLFNMPEYGDLLKMGHSALIYKTGSRKRKRQHESAYGVNPNHPSQIRAIPHNTMLQQMSWLANSVGGVGAAIVENKEWYWEMMQHSPRMKQIMTMVWYARVYSSHNTFYAYSELYNPDLWLRRAHSIFSQIYQKRSQQDRVNELRRIAELLGSDNTYANLAKIVRALGNDSIELGISLARTAKIWDEVQLPFESIALHNRLILVHVIRLALQMQSYHLAMKIPLFAPYADVTYETVIGHIFEFDIMDALEMLEKIFPRENNLPDFAEYGGPATYLYDDKKATLGYAHLHQQIFVPLARIHNLLQQTGGVLTNFISAHG